MISGSLDTEDSGVRPKHRFLNKLNLTDLIVGVVICLLSAGAITVLQSHFYGFVYAYHDLGVITDWFTNAIYRGRPFWITDYGINHLAVHFSPTHLLLIPAYLFSSSSFVLLVLGVLQVGAGLYVSHRFSSALFRPMMLAEWHGALASIGVILLVALNPFVKSVLDSAHAELFYIPLSLGFMHALIFSESLPLAIVLFLLSLGVRAEAGMYLAFQCLSLAFLPREVRSARPDRNLRRMAFLFAAVSIAYVIVVVKIVNPLVFNTHDGHIERGWSRWGSTWFQVILAMVCSPKAVLLEVFNSSCLRLNQSFAFLPWLSPVGAFLINLPGVLLYAASSVDKKFLWYYNASFLLPGFIVWSHVGIYRFVRWLSTFASRARLPRWSVPAATVAVAAMILTKPLASLQETAESPHGFSFREKEGARDDAAAIRQWLSTCPAASRVATDFRHIIYVPNREERYLLRNFQQADAIFLFRDADPMLSGDKTPDELGLSLASMPDFTLDLEARNLRVYRRRSIQCLQLARGG